VDEPDSKHSGLLPTETRLGAAPGDR
jgi:hypothetical protein